MQIIEVSEHYQGLGIAHVLFDVIKSWAASHWWGLASPLMRGVGEGQYIRPVVTMMVDDITEEGSHFFRKRGLQIRSRVRCCVGHDYELFASCLLSKGDSNRWWE